MNFRSILMLMILWICFSSMAISQTDAKTAAAETSPIFVTAHGMSGDVVLLIDIDATGKVVDAKAGSGDRKLVARAIQVAKLFAHKIDAGKTGVSERIHFTSKNDFAMEGKYVYPPIAQAARNSGVVELVGVIDSTGHVSQVTVASGPPMLQGAAVAGYKDFVYKTETVDGHAIPSVALIDVTFTLLPGGGPLSARVK